MNNLSFEPVYHLVETHIYKSLFKMIIPYSRIVVNSLLQPVSRKVIFNIIKTNLIDHKISTQHNYF